MKCDDDDDNQSVDRIKAKEKKKNRFKKEKSKEEIKKRKIKWKIILILSDEKFFNVDWIILSFFVNIKKKIKNLEDAKE